MLSQTLRVIAFPFGQRPKGYERSEETCSPPEPLGRWPKGEKQGVKGNLAKSLANSQRGILPPLRSVRMTPSLKNGQLLYYYLIFSLSQENQRAPPFLSEGGARWFL